MTAVSYAPARRPLGSRTLADAIRAEGRLPLDQVCRIGLRLLDALEAAHAAGVVHGNVQPGTVQLFDDDRVILLFGAEGGVAEPTRDGDLVALGATLFAASAGRPGFLRPMIDDLLDPGTRCGIDQIRAALTIVQGQFF
jgi:hypothetical protein